MGAKAESVRESSEEIEKEAEKYIVSTFADILRALRAHPDWLEELRRLILTEELIELPRKFNELAKKMERMGEKVDKIGEDVGVLKEDVAVIKQDVAVLKQDVGVLKQDVAVLKQDVAVLKQDVAILKQDVEVLKKDISYLKGEVGRLKESDFERKVREKYYAFLGRLLRKLELIDMRDLLSIIEKAEADGKMTEEQYLSLLEIDLIVEGEIKSTQKPVTLAVEVSYAIFEEDLRRVRERADLLSFLLGKEVIPAVVVVEISAEMQNFADAKGILVVKVKD